MHLDEKKLNTVLDGFAEHHIHNACFGNVGICVMQNDNEIYNKYFGNCNGDTLFRIASMTKPITAVAVLIQVSQGLLELDKPIYKYLPEFGAESNKKLVTLRMLLTHTSGVGAAGAFDKAYANMLPSDKQSLECVVSYISKQELAFVPNTRQTYSPFWAFDILARLVEITSKKTFELFLRENIFTPCDMKNTTFIPTKKQWSNMVQMHDRKSENGIFQNTVGATIDGCVFENIPSTWQCGGAGLASTLPDYVKFAQMLLFDGVAENGVSILPQNYVEQMAEINSDLTATQGG